MFRSIKGRKRTYPVLSSQKAYANWAASYPPIPHNPLMQLEQNAMLSMLPPLKDCIVLDLGTGSGRYARLALQREAQCVVGVDNSEPMLRKGMETNVNAHFMALVGELDAVPVAPEQFDGVLCGLVLGHVADISPVLCEISRILKPHGFALISDLSPALFEAGAQRTFTLEDGQIFAVEHYIHTYANYANAIHQAGMQITQCRTFSVRVSGNVRPTIDVYLINRLG